MGVVKKVWKGKVRSLRPVYIKPTSVGMSKAREVLTGSVYAALPCMYKRSASSDEDISRAG